MCRIMYLQNPKKVIKNVGKDWMIEFLEYLENVNGGHGNGVGGLVKTNSKKKFKIKKGLGLSHKDAVEFMINNNFVNGVMWHTRMASSGSIDSKHNHPHTDLDHIVMLVHNGHISYADEYLRALKVMDRRYWNYTYYGYNYYGYQYYKTKNEKEKVTDTWIMANMIAKLIKLGIVEGKTIDDVMKNVWEKMLSHDAVIVQVFNGTVYLLIDRDDFEWIYDEDLGTIAVSQGLYYMGYEKTIQGKGVVKIPVNGKPEIIAGKFKTKTTKKAEKETRKKEINIEEVEVSDINTDCMDLCEILYGGVDECIEICRGKEFESVEELTEYILEHI